MKRLATTLLALSPFASCGTSNAPLVTAAEVVVASGDVAYTLARGDSFRATWMVFGGASFDRRDGISNVVVSGLDMEEARPIYARYPDFHQCHSAGASQAQDAIEQLNLVPANDDVLTALEETLAEHEASIQSGADRVSVHLEGSRLVLTAAVLDGEDITSQLPAAMPRGYLLVQSAELVDTHTELAGRGTR